MINSDAAIQIRSLRAQLDVLEARLRVGQAQTHSLADLRGILEQETPTSAREIDAAKYRGSQALQA